MQSISVGGHIEPFCDAAAIEALRMEIVRCKTPSPAVLELLLSGRLQPAAAAAALAELTVLEGRVNHVHRPLIAQLRRAVESCVSGRVILRIESPEGRGGERIGAGVMALIGCAWMFGIRAVAPGWAISKSYSPHSGIPIWTFGMYFVMAGAALGLAAVSRSFRHWCGDYPGWLFVLIILAIVSWLVACANAGFLPD